MYGGQSTYIPLKVNQCRRDPDHLRQLGALPPGAARRTCCPTDGWGSQRAEVRSTTTWCSPTSLVYMLVYGLLIIGFAYFYTAIPSTRTSRPTTIRKQGGFIPGIRPGPQTERYLAKILNRITLPGALFLAAVALLPVVRARPTLPANGSQVVVRRHLDPHRRRRRPRDDEADRQPADDAQLRGLPEVAPRAVRRDPRRPARHPRPAGGGQGHAVRPPVARTTSCRTSPPATCCRAAVKEGTEFGLQGQGVHGRGRAACPTTSWSASSTSGSTRATRQAAASSSTASPAPSRQAEALDEHHRRRARSTWSSTSRCPEDVVLERLAEPAGVRRLRRQLLRRRAARRTAGPATSAAARSCSATTTPRRPSRKRLDLYERETAPLIDWSTPSAACSSTVDGIGTPDEVTARLVAAIDAPPRLSAGRCCSRARRRSAPPTEIAKMRRAGRVVAEMHERIRAAIRPGRHHRRARPDRPRGARRGGAPRRTSSATTASRR